MPSSCWQNEHVPSGEHGQVPTSVSTRVGFEVLVLFPLLSVSQPLVWKPIEPLDPPDEYANVVVFVEVRRRLVRHVWPDHEGGEPAVEEVVDPPIAPD